MSLTWWVLKLEIFKETNDLHPSNIWPILVAESVLNSDISKEIKL